MGKNRKSGNGSGGGSPKNLADKNTKVIQSLIDDLESQLEDADYWKKESLERQIKEAKKLLDYCNKNNLELNETHPQKWFINGVGKEFTPLLSIHDHGNGKNYVVYDDKLRSGYTRYIDTTRKTLNNISKKVTNNLENVNIVDHLEFQDILRVDSLGNYHAGTRNIQISPSAFEDDEWGTGASGAIAHELGHLYDYQTLGKGKQFGSTDPQLTAFGNYGYGTSNPVGPTEYSTTHHVESISTVFEQVYTGKLRSDATMKNGKSVADDFYKKNKREGTSEELYKYWHDDWSDLTSIAENVLK